MQVKIVSGKTKCITWYGDLAPDRNIFVKGLDNTQNMNFTSKEVKKRPMNKYHVTNFLRMCGLISDTQGIVKFPQNIK